MMINYYQVGCPPDHVDVKSVIQWVYLLLFTLCQYNVFCLGAICLGACCLMFTAYCLRMLDLRLNITTCLETPGEFWTKI